MASIGSVATTLLMGPETNHDGVGILLDPLNGAPHIQYEPSGINSKYGSHSLSWWEKKYPSFVENNIRSIFQQCLEALRSLNADSLYHGSLNMNNIVIDKYGQVTIIVIGHLIDTDESEVFTQQYRSPEEVLATVPDAKSDMWSLACIVYRIITGKHFSPIGRAKDSDCMPLLAQSILKRLDRYNQSDQSPIERALLQSSRVARNKSCRPWQYRLRKKLSIPSPVLPTQKQILLPKDQRLINLLEGIFKIDSEMRLSATEALLHPYFNCNATHISFCLNVVGKIVDWEIYIYNPGKQTHLCKLLPPTYRSCIHLKSNLNLIYIFEIRAQGYIAEKHISVKGQLVEIDLDKLPWRKLEALPKQQRSYSHRTEEKGCDSRLRGRNQSKTRQKKATVVVPAARVTRSKSLTSAREIKSRYHSIKV